MRFEMYCKGIQLLHSNAKLKMLIKVQNVVFDEMDHDVCFTDECMDPVRLLLRFSYC